MDTIRVICCELPERFDDPHADLLHKYGVPNVADPCKKGSRLRVVVILVAGGGRRFGASAGMPTLSCDETLAKMGCPYFVAG